MKEVPGYKELGRILDLAYKQSALEKGVERHGQKDEPWHKQPIIRHQKAYGVGFALGQSAKKMEESMAMDKEAALREILGAIVYAAGAYYFIEKERDAVREES